MDVQELIEGGVSEGLITEREASQFLCDMPAEFVTDFLTDRRDWIAVQKAPAKFALGQMVATPAAVALMERDGVEMRAILRRHASGDWGDIHPGDIGMNDAAIADEGKTDADGNVMQDRVMSVYKTASGTLWVITEWDRSVTTVLLPEDY